MNYNVQCNNVLYILNSELFLISKVVNMIQHVKELIDDILKTMNAAVKDYDTIYCVYYQLLDTLRICREGSHASSIGVMSDRLLPEISISRNRT